MSIVINPGSGPAEGGSAEQAWENLQVLLRDVSERYYEVTPTNETPSHEAPEDGGRWVYAVRVTRGEQSALLDVEMPGRPLDQVRWMRRPDQDLWEFPRLYVDGSSWVWWYAIKALGAHPFGDEDD